MGVCNYGHNKFIESVVYLENSRNPETLDVIELGDQEMVINGHCSPQHKFRDHCGMRFRSWRTLDLHKVPGVEIYDLSEVSGEKDICDILTNFGTSEHVELEEGQYNCWVNIHNFIRIGGMALHVVPPTHAWLDHSRYHYSEEFFKNFENYGYKIIQLSFTYNSQIMCLMKKVEKKDFMSYDEFIGKITILQVDSEQIYEMNNPKNLTF